MLSHFVECGVKNSKPMIRKAGNLGSNPSGPIYFSYIFQLFKLYENRNKYHTFAKFIFFEIYLTILNFFLNNGKNILRKFKEQCYKNNILIVMANYWHYNFFI